MRGWREPQLNFYLLHWSSQTSGLDGRQQNVTIFEGLTTHCYRLRSVHLWPPGEAKWRKSASHHVWKVSGALEATLAAREVRSSGLLEAPEVPGDGPDGPIFMFLDFAQMAFLNSKWPSGNPRGGFRGRPGSSWAVLGNFNFSSFFDLLEFCSGVKSAIADTTLA